MKNPALPEKSLPLPEKTREKARRTKADRVLAFLDRLTTELTADLHLPHLLEGAIHLLRDEAGFDSCTLALVDDRNLHRLVIRAASGIRESFRNLEIPRGKGLHWVAIETGEPLLIPDMRADVRVFRRGDAIRSGIYAPLKVRTQILGAVAAHRTEVGAFTKADLDLLTVVARYLASVIEVARLHEHLEQRVAERTAQLGDASRAKSEFLSRMSHELRTPLNAILGFAQLLEMDHADRPDQKESVDHILNAGRHLLDLVNEVLDIARIETGRLAISPESVSVKDVIQEGLDLVVPLAAARDITLKVEAAGLSDRFIFVDRQRLKQVLLNLLSNAVKYNRPGGEVALSYAEVQGGRLRINVSDTGPGIPPDRLGQLFTPFERLGAEQTGIEGTGLGLALSKRLVEAMRGTMGVNSTVGRGSTFWVEFASAQPPARPGKPGRPETAPSPAAAARGAFTVLYIEDNLSSIELIQRLLGRGSETKLLSAMQGRLGLDLAREHRPDLILLDLNLPDISGAEVMRLLQADPKTGRIPVVVISADATSAQIRRLLDAGVRAYLTKPLDVKQFFGLLSEIRDEVLKKKNGPA